MRRLQALLAILALAFLAPAPAATQSDDDYSNARIVRLSLVDGDAQVFRPEQGEWEAARQNLPIQKAYAVATGRGRVEIEFESGGTARLDENTELEFTELALVNGARVTTLRLERGSAVFYANGEKRDVFEVLIGRYRAKVDRNARLRIDVHGDDVLIAVLKGNADVETAEGTQRLTKNQEMRIGAYGVDIARHGDSDEFEQWAHDREELLTASYDVSRQYVNAPFRYGISDLSNHGYWYYDSTYGNVWQPHAVGFTPYVNGSWLWVNGYGWSWVGYESWGWLPYHYGRWAWTGYGWAWAPGHFNRWSPAHVAWVRFGDGRLGWCPLNPHDRHGRRPRNLHGGTAIWNRGRPEVRNVNTAGTPPTVVERPTRETLGNEFGFGSRNPRTDRAGRAPHGRAPETEATVAGPRSGFSGSANSLASPGRPPRRGGDETGRNPVAGGDVRYDRGENRYVNTPLRESESEANAPRSGWGASASGGRPRPNFTRGENGSPSGGSNVNRSGSPTGSGPRYGTTPSGNDARGNAARGNDSRGSGWGGRGSSSGQQTGRSSPPPRSSGSQSGASQRPSNPPPRSSSPPPQQQRQPSYSPPRQSSLPPVRQSPAPAPRQSPPPRPRGPN